MQHLEDVHEYFDDLADVFKIRVDLFKHLATLSSGAIVVAAAFIRELPAESNTLLLALSLISFVFTIVLAAWASFYTLGYILTGKQYIAGVVSLAQFQKIDRGRGLGILPFISFFIGMASLVFFSLSAI